MAEFNFSVNGGDSIRLKTAGKYCDRDIVVTGSGSNTGTGDVNVVSVCTVAEIGDKLTLPIGGDDRPFVKLSDATPTIEELTGGFVAEPMVPFNLGGGLSFRLATEPYGNVDPTIFRIDSEEEGAPATAIAFNSMDTSNPAVTTPLFFIVNEEEAEEWENLIGTTVEPGIYGMPILATDMVMGRYLVWGQNG